LRRDFLDIESELFTGRKQTKNAMLIVLASDKGLCGNFNYLIGKEVAELVAQMRRDGLGVHIIGVGNKICEQLKKIHGNVESMEFVANFFSEKDLYENTRELARKAIDRFTAGPVDVVSIVYSVAESVVRHTVTKRDIIPIVSVPNNDHSITIFEPSLEEVLEYLIPYNISIQVYQAALESITSEQSARMASMDNATRNAESLLDELNIKYNRFRQAKITQDLTEIISGTNVVSKDR
jgi:F-type H+-transporting ATPase subunit gamma